MTFSIDEDVAKYYRLTGQYETVFVFRQEGSEGLQSYYAFRFIISLYYRNPKKSVKSRNIKIDEPYVEYYEENKGKLAYTMTPPSEKQLEEHLE